MKTAKPRRPLISLLLTLWIAGAPLACKDQPPQCIPGASAPCACAVGPAGAQVCQADGTFGRCQCTAAVPVAPLAAAAVPTPPVAPTPPPTPPAPQVDVPSVISRLNTGINGAHRATQQRMDQGETFGGSEGTPCVESIRDERRRAVARIERALPEGITALDSSDPSAACAPLRALRGAVVVLGNGETQAVNVDGPGSESRAHCDEPAVPVPPEVQDVVNRLRSRCP